MELNGFNSKDYIYLKVMDDIKNNKGDIVYKRGQILRFLRDDLECKLYSRLISQGFSDNIEEVRKNVITDDDILPSQLLSKVTFTKDGKAYPCLWPGEIYCFSKWIMDHLMVHEEDVELFEGIYYRDLKNRERIDKYTKCVGVTEEGYPVLEVVDRNLDLIFTFKKGDEVDYNDPGIKSLFLNPFYLDLINKSHIIKDTLKDKLFLRDFKNTFRANRETYYGFSNNEEIFHYYKVKDDVFIKDNYEMPGVNCNISTRRCDGMADIVYIEAMSEEYLDRFDETYMRSIGVELPIEEALEYHLKRLEKERLSMIAQREKWHRQALEHEEKIEKLMDEHRNDAEMFPGINGNFISTSTRDVDKTYSLDEIKNFFRNLSKLDKDAIDFMYFYGGTIPYILTDATKSREFGDIDIFVPIEKMALVRQTLKLAGLKIIFDSLELSAKHNFTSRIKEIEKEDNNSEILTALINNDEKAIKQFTEYGRVLSDFGFKGNLFGVNISIFPLYEYDENLMAKSFKVDDAHEYLLAVRVVDNMKVNELIKNVNIYGCALNIMPLEYTIVSKEGAIHNGYIKRSDKDYKDLEYISEHKEELRLDDELLNRLRENYPDYSIALAYFLYENSIERVSGQKYKELVLEHGGEYVT